MCMNFNVFMYQCACVLIRDYINMCICHCINMFIHFNVYDNQCVCV